jgi:flagellar biosynthesis protein FliP
MIRLPVLHHRLLKPLLPKRRLRLPGRRFCFFFLLALGCLTLAGDAHAASVPTLDRSFLKKAESPEEVATTIEILIALTVLSLAPALLTVTQARGLRCFSLFS